MKLREYRKHQLYRNTIGLLPRSTFLYKVCHIYLRHYFGFNWGLGFDDGELWLVAQMLGSNPELTVFDVGANIGDWTLGVLGRYPGAHVHAFEPSPDIYMRMVARVSAMNVKLNPVGVGAKHGSLEFFEYGTSAISSFHPRADSLPKKTHKVDMVSIADYCQETQVNHIDFLKIDTEGHDFYVLQGAEPLLKNQQVDVIQFEYGPANIDAGILLKDILGYLQSLPYHLFRLYPRYLLPVSNYSKELENFISVNYVLIATDQLQRNSSL